MRRGVDCNKKLAFKSSPLSQGSMRNQTNMQMIAIFFKQVSHLLLTGLTLFSTISRSEFDHFLTADIHQPLQDSDKAAVVLASVFQELLLRMEDYLRSLRTLLREIVRALHYELNFPKFALALMEEVNMQNSLFTVYPLVFGAISRYPRCLLK